MRASCQCGRLTAHAQDTAAPAVVLCHCTACRKRSGSPFGAVAYFQPGEVKVSGQAREFTRPADSGAPFTTGFCETCGTTIYIKTARHADALGVPVGTFADPTALPAPVRSVFEECMLGGVGLPDGMAHFPRGRDG